MNQIWGLILSVFILFSAVSSCCVATDAPDDTFGWKFVILGDTQDLVHCPELFFNATYWIANQSDIVYVAQMGDLVDNRDNLTQWQTAYDAMHVLDGHVNWGSVPGNHDLIEYGTNETSCVEDATNYNTFFGGCEHYDIVEDRFIFIYARFDHLDYVESVLQAHPKLYAIVVTHSYISSLLAIDEYFQETLAKYDNVIAVLCGHNTGSRLLRYYDGDGGINNIILTNYQDFPNAINAFKICTVFEDRIEVETFEPMTNTYRNETDGFLEEFSFLYGKDLTAGFFNERKLFAETDFEIVDLKIADLTSDPGNEVVVAGGPNNIVAVFNSTGNQIASAYNEQAYSLGIIDFNNDGQLEIVCGGTELTVYDSNLEILEILLSNRNSTRPVMVTVTDVDNNDVNELLTVDYDDNSMTQFRVWSEGFKVADFWAEENLNATLYEPRNYTMSDFQDITLENGTTVSELVSSNITITYSDVWPTCPKVMDLNCDGKNEVYVRVPCGCTVSYGDDYSYIEYNWGGIVDFFDEDGDGQSEVYGIGDDVFGQYSFSGIGSFYVGGTPASKIYLDLDSDGDSEIIWHDKSGNQCVFDEGKMASVYDGLNDVTLFSGSLTSNSEIAVFVATDGGIYVYENYRAKFEKSELQTRNNEYWFNDQPNIVSTSATLTEVTNQPATGLSVNSKFIATVSLTHQETVNLKIDVGSFGAPTGCSISEWTYNATSNSVILTASGSNPTITLYWAQTSGRELVLILPYLVVVGFFLILGYFTIKQSKKKGRKFPQKAVVLEIFLALTLVVLLLLVNFIS